ncbi:MAG: alanine racemase [Pseudomonadota bacterium]
MTQPLANNRPTHVVIDRQAFKHNLARVRDYCPDAKVMAVIKADAYGHGMVVAAKAMEDADEFGVTSLDDVQQLRAAGITTPMTLLSAVLNSNELSLLAPLNVRPTIYDLAQLSAFENASDHCDLSVWLKVDTGMGRLGLSPAELPDALRRLAKIKAIRDISLMSHLANADLPGHVSNAEQLDQFKHLATEYAYKELSILNSGGIISFADAAESMTRPGVMLYGISPIIGQPAAHFDLQPVMTLKSSLIAVRELPSGSCIGYGSTYVLDQDTRIGVVACGYGDGYPRHAKSGTSVWVNDSLVPLIGRVSMDMLTVDLGPVQAKVGDPVVLWGAENPVETVANSAGTIAYELCCGILPRVERVVV